MLADSSRALTKRPLRCRSPLRLVSRMLRLPPKKVLRRLLKKMTKRMRK
jgi:hypothetical protein